MSTDLEDDLSITDDTELWRRILPFEGSTRSWYKRDEHGQLRAQSVAFMDNLSFELSAYIAVETDLAALRQRYPYVNVASFLAGVPRQFGFIIHREPDDFESHVVIIAPPGLRGREKYQVKARRDAGRAMALASTWVYLGQA